MEFTGRRLIHTDSGISPWFGVASRNLPETDAPIAPTHTSERVTVRTERYAIDIICMPLKRCYVLTCCNIPQTDSKICASTSERVTVWTERYAKDPIRMPFKRSYVLTCCDIPQSG